MVYLYYLMKQHNLTILTIINLILQVENQDTEKLKWFTLVHIVCRLVPEAMPPSPNCSVQSTDWLFLGSQLGSGSQLLLHCWKSFICQTLWAPRKHQLIWNWLFICLFCLLVCKQLKNVDWIHKRMTGQLNLSIFDFSLFHLSST